MRSGAAVAVTIRSGRSGTSLESVRCESSDLSTKFVVSGKLHLEVHDLPPVFVGDSTAHFTKYAWLDEWHPVVGPPNPEHAFSLSALSLSHPMLVWRHGRIPHPDRSNAPTL